MSRTKRVRRATWSCTALIAILSMFPVTPAPAQTTERSVRLQATASKARLNRRVLGPVTESVRGVPAQPVDSFVYDGVGSTPIEASLFLEVNERDETGFIFARWKDENGKWTYTQSEFIHPEHSSGVRLGRSVTEIDSFINEGITSNVYLHGDTGAGMPVLPTLFNYLATWGPAEVTLDGAPFENPYELPAPRWLGHLMITEGVRHPDGTVRTVTGEIYDPSSGGEGALEPGDLEVHLVFHDERFPMTANKPPIFEFFYHLVFEEVNIEILHSEIEIGGSSPGPAPSEPGQRGGALHRDVRR